jgi:hypothetical protein
MKTTLERATHKFRFSKKSSAPFRFLDLPAELRIKVYTEIIHSSSICTFWRPRSKQEHILLDRNSDSVCTTNPLRTARLKFRKYDVRGLQSLRLTCHCIRNELDHERVQYVIHQVEDLVRSSGNSVGRIDGVTVFPSWSSCILFTIEHKSKTFKDSQCLRITGHSLDVWNLVMSGKIQHRNFIHALAPHIRSLTFNLVVPESFSAFSSEFAHETLQIRVRLLVLRMQQTMMEKAYCAAGFLYAHSIPPTGVREIRINIPPLLSHSRTHDWLSRSFQGYCGIDSRSEQNQEGKLTGIVISLNGGHPQCVAEEARFAKMMSPKKWRGLKVFARSVDKSRLGSMQQRLRDFRTLAKPYFAISTWRPRSH